MKKLFALFVPAMLVVGCASYTTPHASMYSDYGFTYDYNQSPVPSALEVAATATPDASPAPTVLVQVPPPTVIYQTTPGAVQTSVDTNTATGITSTDEANPYKGSYVIPPKVVVVPQQTIIHDAAGAAPGTASSTTTQAQPAIGGYPNYPINYIYPGFVGNVSTNTNAPGTNVAVNVTNQNVNSITNTINEAAGARRSNAAPFTAVPGHTNSAIQQGAQPASALQRPASQSTTGTGTGQAAQSTAGGSFAPPPSGTGTLPANNSLQRPATSQSTSGSGTGQPAPTTSGGSFAPPPPGTTPLPGTGKAPTP